MTKDFLSCRIFMTRRVLQKNIHYEWCNTIIAVKKTSIFTKIIGRLEYDTQMKSGQTLRNPYKEIQKVIKFNQA